MASSTTARKVAMVLGAGPGTGAGIAKAFFPSHNLALLSRSQGTLDSTVASLPSSSTDRVLTVPTDSTNPSSLTSAFETVKTTWPESYVEVAIYNAGGGKFAPGSFLDKTTQDLRDTLEGGVLGAFEFAQQFLKQLPAGAHGTLIFTGATMSIRGGANFSAMAAGKAATRSLAQSLAREFHPKGVHVAHTIIDGLIDTERVRGMVGDTKGEGTRLDPNEIGKAYLYLHNQHPSVWTQEMDLRPMKENF